MQILTVTGATGQLGQALVRRLANGVDQIRLFVRRPPPADLQNFPNVEVVFGQLSDSLAVEKAVTNASVVFHAGAAMGGPWEAHEAATITGTRNVIESCLKHRVPKVIHISSLSVIDWAGHPRNHPVTENSPLEPAPARRGFYTQAKLEAERLVREAAATRQLPVVIIRPGKIWSESGSLVDAAVALRVGRRYLLIGDGEIRLPLIHVDDVVEAIVKATQSPYTDGRIYQVVGDEPLTRAELLSLHIRGRDPGASVIHLSLGLACALARVVEIGFSLLRRNAPLTPYRLQSAYAPLTFDCQKARTELGWQPQVKSATMLRKLVLNPL
jgi:nucleoside-diphosphate-sugar epimerase